MFCNKQVEGDQHTSVNGTYEWKVYHDNEAFARCNVPRTAERACLLIFLLIDGSSSKRLEVCCTARLQPKAVALATAKGED